MPERDGADYRAALMDDALRERLIEVVRLHSVMFERLLIDQASIGSTVADLLRDIGETYLEFSEALRSGRS